MKNVCAGIWILLIICLVCGCSSSGQPVRDETAYQERPQDNENQIVVGFSQVGSESDWRNANSESFRSVFTEENGYYLVFEDAQQKQENQLKAVRDFILQEVDYIVLDPIVETGWDSVLVEAKDAGIPVIIVDRQVKVEDDDLYTCWVGSDFRREGRLAGKWLEKYLESQGRGKDRIRMVTLQGTPGSSPQIGRTKGFASVMKRHKNWEMLEYQSGDFTQAKGQEVMEHFLKTYDGIDVVVSENDNMTFGAVEAIEEAGLTCGPDGDMIVLSFDAVRAALQAMEAGKINADFECNPLLGSMVSDIIHRLERKETVDKIQYVDEQYFDSDMDLSAIMDGRAY